MSARARVWPAAFVVAALLLSGEASVAEEYHLRDGDGQCLWNNCIGGNPFLDYLSETEAPPGSEPCSNVLGEGGLSEGQGFALLECPGPCVFEPGEWELWLAVRGGAATSVGGTMWIADCADPCALISPIIVFSESFAGSADWTQHFSTVTLPEVVLDEGQTLVLELRAVPGGVVECLTDMPPEVMQKSKATTPPQPSPAQRSSWARVKALYLGDGRG